MGTSTIEPYLMSLLANRMSSIAIRMNNAMVKSARSSILALARDCSTAICDRNGDVLTFPYGLPVHVGGATLTARSLLELQGHDLRPGDAYLHNSPYHGNTHPGDHTIMVPVFHEDDLMFIAFCKGHQADIGNSIPTTYHARAKDVYEEGALIFPCVRVQRDYKDIQDIIRMCKMRIRVPEVWYGDYLAMVGAARIGERELRDLILQYGKKTIKTFCQEYMEYGRRVMIDRIKKLPAGKAHYETTYDPIPDLLPEGITVKVDVTVEPEEGLITIDYTDNDDSKPCGLNLCEATLTAAARAAILNRLAVSTSTFPCCEGALSRIIVKMREASIVGKAKHPFSSSVATNNINDRALVAVQCAMNQITDFMAMAEPHWDMGPSIAVISGTDSRFGNRPYVTQLTSGWSGAGGMNGHDGHLFYAVSTGGAHYANPIEMVEQRYPILYVQQEFQTDALGSGQWDSSPSARTIIRATTDPVTMIWVCDGHHNPARGAAGGLDGVPTSAYRLRFGAGKKPERIEELPAVCETVIRPGEAIESIYSSGGGYGDPLDRDPELVRHRVREEWISPIYAKDVYGVILDTKPESFAVDWETTKELRQRLKNERKADT